MKSNILRNKRGGLATSSFDMGDFHASNLALRLRSRLVQSKPFKAMNSRIKPVTTWYRYNTVRGNRSGLAVLSAHLGASRAVNLALRLQLRLLRNPPFKAMNSRQKPSLKELMSQRQLAPVVVLYQLLREDGESESDCLTLLLALIQEVGIGFMRFSFPEMSKDQFRKLSLDGKRLMLSRTSELFFNSESTWSLDGDQAFRVDVHHCHFAHYSKALGLPQLGSLFCQVDKPYFERHQPDIVFFRSQTLADDQLPCDFHFQWR